MKNKLFKHISKNFNTYSKYHESQSKFLNDSLILVDLNDNPISPISKMKGFLLFIIIPN